MLISHSLQRFAERLAVALKQRRRASRLRSRRSAACYPVAAYVDVLEARQLLSSIVVNSAAGGQNYSATVTFSQLDPSQTAVTLRDAINAANNTTGADTIWFDVGVFPPNAPTPTTIVLAGETPLQITDLSGATTIDGPGAAQVAVSGNQLSTVFFVNVGATLAIDGLTITGGKGSIDIGGGLKAGGGVYNNGQLILHNTVITANSAGNYGGGFYNSVTGTVTVSDSTIAGNSGQVGGGFFNGGVVTVSDSTISGNSVTSNGGGFYNLATVTLTGSLLANNSAGVNGGGFFSNNTAAVINSTITGNAAGILGGGFINQKTATIIDSTIAGNFASQGGGIYNALGTATLNGTILARNYISATNPTPRDWAGLAAGAGSSHNLVGDGTGTGLTNGTNHNLVGPSLNPLNPRLAPLGDYGGPTLTMALLPGSLALGAGSDFTNPATGSLIGTDQRGVLRSSETAPDIGAYQSTGFAFVATDGDGQFANVDQNFDRPLVVQLTEKAFGRVLQDAGMIVSFVAPAASSSAILSAGSAVTDANGVASVTARANGTIGGPYEVFASSAGIDPAAFQLTNIEVPGLVVNTSEDRVDHADGLTSLREAIAYAGTLTTAATITFEASVFPDGILTTITLGGSALVLTNTAAPVAIVGPGTGQVAISANRLSSVFVVEPHVSAEIVGLTITGGNGTSGGGIYNAGMLALRNTTLAGNSAGSGGGLYNSGSVSVNGSTLSGNSAVIGGGYFGISSTVIVNSTISGNSATTGAGLCNSGGTVTLIAATIAGNVAQSGGGVYNDHGVVTLFNTLLALNHDGPAGATPGDWLGTAADADSSFNLIGVGTNSGLIDGANHNIVGDSVHPIEPYLAPLADNGGPTQTMALLAGSKAINAGDSGRAGSLATDQRGSGFGRIAGNGIDIGAFEIQSHPPAAPTVDSLTTTDSTPTLAGTWDSTNAGILQVTISSDSASYAATYTLGSSPQLVASGRTWTLNVADTNPLAVGTYKLQVHTVNDIGETADSAVGTLLIISTPPIVEAIDPLSANVGQQVSISTDITGGDSTGLTVTIAWGDGTTTAGTIASVNGILTATGSHAYSTAGTFDILVSVTNASGLTANSATTATIAGVSSAADLLVTAGRNVQIVATSANANYDFDVTFVAGGLQLTGMLGTTFNGATTLFVANGKSVFAQLADGDDHVRIFGKGQNVILSMGGGQNGVTCKNFEGEKLQVSSDGALTMHAWNSTLTNLRVTGGASTDDIFRSSGLRVTNETQLALAGGANRVRINDSHFKNFKLLSSGSGTIIRIEAGRADGTKTQFDGGALFLLGDGARLTFSPHTTSDDTIFNGRLIINAGSVDATWRYRNVQFAHRAILNNVDVV